MIMSVNLIKIIVRKSTHVFKALFEFDQNISEQNVVLVDFPVKDSFHFDWVHRYNENFKNNCRNN